ncbi:MAG TPA: sulfite exporter TauE/SafE family protein [Candidatus Angelobacter sp.]|jgi:hypothetical protein
MNVIHIALGLVLSLAIVLTGVGGGTLTTPALILLGLPPIEAVGTAMIFAALTKLVATPMYLARKQVNFSVLGSMLLGAVPGLMAGAWVLHWSSGTERNGLVLLLVGIVIGVSAILNLLREGFGPVLIPFKLRRWVPYASFPIGVEMAVSASGAGTLGTLLLLNIPALEAVEVVATNVVFGFVLSVLGAGLHLTWSGVDMRVLSALIAGGIPGAFLGAAMLPKAPKRALRVVISALLVGVSVQLIVTSLQHS